MRNYINQVQQAVLANEIESLRDQLHTVVADVDSYEIHEHLEACEQELAEVEAAVGPRAKTAIFHAKPKKPATPKKPKKPFKTKAKEAWRAAKHLGKAVTTYHMHNADVY